MRKNVAGQTVDFQMNSTANGGAVTTGTPVVYVKKGSAARTVGTGTSTHSGDGQWQYAPSQTEIDADEVKFQMTLSGAITQVINFYPVAFDPTDATTLGLVNLDTTISSRNAVTPPTVAELNARTLATAGYFDPVNDDVAVVTGITNNVGITQSGADKVWSSPTRTLTAFSTALALSIWNVLESAVLLASTMGLKVKSNLDVAVSSRNDITPNTVTPPTVPELNARTILAANYATISNQNTILGRIGAFTGTGINTILGFFQSLFRSDIATDPTDIGGTYDSTSDSIESIRDRGDSAWITGGGGGITDVLNVVPLIPNSVDLANTATVRMGLMLTNAVDDLPTAAEITPGTISIDRKAAGGTSWTAVVADAVCLESSGMIYFDEVFNTTSGYFQGDSIRVTFKSQKITVSANDYEITDAIGRLFYTSIRQSAVAGGDWTTAEKANIRDSLGVDGTKTAATGGQLQTVKTVADGIQTDLDNSTDGLGALKGGIDGIPTTPAPSVVAIRSEIDSNSTQFAAILGRIGAFTGTGINTILGFFQSLFRSDIATDPTDIGGTYNSTTDSLEGNRDNLDVKIPTNLTFTGADVHVTLDGEKVVLDSVNHAGAVIPVVSVLSGHTPQSGNTFGALPANFSDLSIAITSGLVDVADKTGFRLSATGVNDILRTALTESYAAKGAPPTLEQFMSMILSLLADYGVSGTTISARRLDGVTTAMTFTTDDATKPTTRTRTT